MRTTYPWAGLWLIERELAQDGLVDRCMRTRYLLAGLWLDERELAQGWFVASCMRTSPR